MKELRTGDLVVVPDGYYGIVNTQSEDKWMVFLSNGLQARYTLSELVPLPLKADLTTEVAKALKAAGFQLGSVSNFGEIIGEIMD